MPHLRDYLADKGRGSAAALARAIGSPHATIHDVARDKFWPSRSLWLRIVDATDGQVTPNDHLNSGRDGD